MCTLRVEEGAPRPLALESQALFQHLKSNLSSDMITGEATAGKKCAGVLSYQNCHHAYRSHQPYEDKFALDFKQMQWKHNYTLIRYVG